MVQALLLLPKRGRHPHERQHLNEAAEIKIPHNRQRQAGARLLKHDVSRRGPMIECKRCGQFWESTATNLILAQGMCPGPKIYGQPQLERPWLIPSKRGPIWWGKHKLHKYHTAAWYRGVLYCSDCGHFSLKGKSCRGLALPCYKNPTGRYCQMTMKLIRHGTRRAGFPDWPNYENKPGAEEPVIAHCAYPDPLWIQGPPPKTYNTGKTVTGVKVAEKIRDLRLRKTLTGSTARPRLVCKTNPKQVQAAQEVDFEEEIANYKKDIEKDIRNLKAQAYHEPQWIKEALRGERETSGADTHAHSNSASSSSWEQPLTDSQAVNLSNYILVMPPKTHNPRRWSPKIIWNLKWS